MAAPTPKKATAHYDELKNFIQQAEAQGLVGEDEAGAPAGPRQGMAGDESAARTKNGQKSKSKSGGIMGEIEDRDEAAGKVSAVPAPRATREMPGLAANDETNMLELLAHQQGMDFVKLTQITLDPKAIEIFPAEYARENKVLPLFFRKDGTVVVAIADPLNVTIADNLRLLLDRSVEAVVAEEQDITDYIDKYFSHSDDIDKVMEDLQREGALATTLSGGEFELDPEQLVHAPPVIKLVNLILMRALKDRASDLHIEPFGSMLRVRYRVDGVLREIPPPPKSLQVGLTSRLKIMANMNIAETRRPQDGRIRLNHQGREVDLRVSSLPTVHGESLVMRILDKQQMQVGIEQIGMTKSVLTRFVEICERPNGIVLVTGPTGSGKTTTLYAAVIKRLNPDEKFITTEDPVEYEVPGLVQVNINTQMGLTFGSCLRAILRQDPDVILVGEIRDVETATISIQASLTGHLVYSTLHTNSAAGTISRLIDMGIEPFLLTSTLQVVIGQRLIRTTCQSCREPYHPTAAELEDFALTHDEIAGITFHRGTGCDECGHTGYRGRLGLFEMLEMTDEIRDLVLDRATSDEIHEAAFNAGMQTMRQDGFIKVCMGVTTFEEVGHHTPRGLPEHVRREIHPIVQQVRQRLGAAGNAPTLTSLGTGQSSAHLKQVGAGSVEHKAPALPSPGKMASGAAVGAGLNRPENPSIPSGEAAAQLGAAPQPQSLHRSAPPQPAKPMLTLPPGGQTKPTGSVRPTGPRIESSALPGMPDIGSLPGEEFLSANSLESATPMADMPDIGDLSTLEGIGPMPDLPDDLK